MRLQTPSLPALREIFGAQAQLGLVDLLQVPRVEPQRWAAPGVVYGIYALQDGGEVTVRKFAFSKEFTLRCVKESLAIAERLYASDKPRYKPLFGWINKMVKQRRSPALIVQALRRLDEKEASERTALDVVEYLSGTLRKLEVEHDARVLRKGGAPAMIGAIDALADLLRKQGYNVEKKS